MTSKERLLIAMTGGKPDRVPVTPDISEMIPSRMTGRPFWELRLGSGDGFGGQEYGYYTKANGEAYLEAVKYFGIDGWDLGYVNLGPSKDDKRKFHREIVKKERNRVMVRDYVETPEGTLWQEIMYPSDNPPWMVRRFIKNFEKDFPIYLKYFFPDPSSCDDKNFQKWKDRVGDLGIVGIWIGYPGFQDLIFSVDGGLEKIVYYYYDYLDLFEEYRSVYHKWAIKMAERVLRAKPDYLMTGGSGTITLSSPEIFRKMGLPTLKEITKMAKNKGIPTLLHSCGKEKDLVKICAEETDLSCVNPLEIPPMGDCILSEIKQKFGDKIALMGNLNTTFMLRATPQEVEQQARKTIEDGGKGGGFILSTGDQCGRDTPDENIFKLVEAAKKYGRYS